MRLRLLRHHPHPSKLTDSDLKLCEKNGAFILDAPFRKIVFTSTVDKTLLVFVRRSGFDDSFKCHVFVFSKSAHIKDFAQELLLVTSRLVRYSSSNRTPLDTLQTALEKRSRCDSTASLNMLPEVCSVSTASVTDSDDDEGDGSASPTSQGSPATSARSASCRAKSAAPVVSPTLVRATPRPVVEKESLCTAPCGICHSAQGDSWIALKNCGHQFHLPVRLHSALEVSPHDMQCMTTWREALHNLCPSCPNPISTGVFSLHYIGTSKLHGTPKPAELARLVTDMTACSCSFVCPPESRLFSDTAETTVSDCK